MIQRINCLEFSPDDKFVFFGRLDKWFSVGRGCVKDFPQFSKNPGLHDWGRFSSDGQHIVVKRNHFLDLPETCQTKRCIEDLLSLWAVKEIYGGPDKEWIYSFRKFPEMVAGFSTMSIKTKSLLRVLCINLMSCEVNDAVPRSNCGSCYFCDQLKELPDPNKESSLAPVRQLIIKLYRWIFRFQVWNLETGRPLLQDVFDQCAQFNPLTYFCHVTSAFDKWGRGVRCAGVDQVMSVCNIAVVTAIDIFFRLRFDWSKRTYVQLTKWEFEPLIGCSGEMMRRGLMREWLFKETHEEVLKQGEREEVIKRKVTKKVVRVLSEVLCSEDASLLVEEMKRAGMERQILDGCLGLWQLIWKWSLQLDLELFSDSFKRDVFLNFPKGFLDLVGDDISHCLSPRKMWMVNSREMGEIHLLRTGFQEQDSCDYSSEKQEYRITQAKYLTFTYDDLYVVYLSREDLLHALSLQTGTVFTSVSGRQCCYFTRERRVGYLFRSGTEERAIFLTSLLNPCRFFRVLPLSVQEGEVGEITAAIFSTSDTVKCISSKSLITAWKLPHHISGFSFESCLAGSRSHLIKIQNCVFSRDGNLLAFQQHTQIKQGHVEAFENSQCTVFEADFSFTDLFLTFSSDGVFLLFSILDDFSGQQFYVWDVKKKALSESFSQGPLTIDSFCISSDNRNLILCGGYEVEIWEFNKYPRRLLERIALERSYNPVKFSQCAVSQDRELLVCCLANEIFVYSLQVADIHSSKRVLRGHLGKIEFCSFLKRNRYLISYAVDGMVFLWDIAESKSVAFARIAKDREKILCMAVSPDEKRAVCFISPSRVCVLNLCNLKCALPADFFTAPRKGEISAAGTSLLPFGQISSTTNIPASWLKNIQPGGFSNRDLEEQYLLTREDFWPSDESDEGVNYDDFD